VGCGTVRGCHHPDTRCRVYSHEIHCCVLGVLLQPLSRFHRLSTSISCAASFLRNRHKSSPVSWSALLLLRLRLLPHACGTLQPLHRVLGLSASPLRRHCRRQRDFIDCHLILVGISPNVHVNILFTLLSGMELPQVQPVNKKENKGIGKIWKRVKTLVRGRSLGVVSTQVPATAQKMSAQQEPMLPETGRAP